MEINMEGAKFKIGQEVSTVNDSHRMVVTSIALQSEYRYTVAMYGNQTITDIAESDMIPYAG
jgi:hypothetical protein